MSEESRARGRYGYAPPPLAVSGQAVELFTSEAGRRPDTEPSLAQLPLCDRVVDGVGRE